MSPFLQFRVLWWRREQDPHLRGIEVLYCNNFSLTILNQNCRLFLEGRAVQSDSIAIMLWSLEHQGGVIQECIV